MIRLLLTALAALAVAPACDRQAPVTTVGPDGGTVVSDDGRVRVAVPRGALADDVTITIGRAGDCYELGPAGTAFAVPAEVTVDAPVEYHFSVLTLDDGATRSVCTRDT